MPADCLPYMRTMAELNGPEHVRMRRLVAPAFTPRAAVEFRPAMVRIVGALLDALPSGEVDLIDGFARPLPMDVICELVGIPAAARSNWRAYGAAVVGGGGPAFATAIPAIMADARAVVAHRGTEPGEDVVSELLAARAADGDQLSEVDIVRTVWHLVLAGQTPTNLVANAVAELLAHPDQLAALRAEPGLLPGAVEELIRWCGPALLTIPRYATEDVELSGTLIRAGEQVTASVAAANRDPRAFADPDRLDVTRAAVGHLGFAHGPHFCLGASLARVQVEVALAELLRRSPNLALVAAERAPDPGTWRLSSLRVRY